MAGHPRPQLTVSAVAGAGIRARFIFRRSARLLAAGLAVAALASPVVATEPASAAPWYDGAVRRLQTTWEDGQAEVYLPLHTYHMRFAYSPQKIAGFDETPLGLGVGKGGYDQRGDWHGLYVMGFHDSHFKPEYIAGYGDKTFWHPTEEIRFGLGYTVFLTTRADTGYYLPIPGVLPIASMEYQRLSLDAAYVPGGQGYGNVLFFWSKIRF